MIKTTFYALRLDPCLLQQFKNPSRDLFTSDIGIRLLVEMVREAVETVKQTLSSAYFPEYCYAEKVAYS